MRAAALFVLVAALAAFPAYADAVDCQGGAVFIGQTALDLLGKCGEPSWSDERIQERSTFVFDPSRQLSEVRKISVIVARWTYDFGPSRFIQTVTLEDGKVVAVDRGGYGSAVAIPRPVRAVVVRCEPQRSFHVGDGMADVLSRCGEPVLRDSKRIERQLAIPDLYGVVYGESVAVDVETWTYNFGATAFQRRLTFVDGKLVKIATGSYGYD